MDYTVHGSRIFKTGVVYRALTPPYEKRGGKCEDIYLVLGPSQKQFTYSDPHPTEYRYLDLLTGKLGDFHRDSYFGEAAELL